MTPFHWPARRTRSRSWRDLHTGKQPRIFDPELHGHAGIEARTGPCAIEPAHLSQDVSILPRRRAPAPTWRFASISVSECPDAAEIAFRVDEEVGG